MVRNKIEQTYVLYRHIRPDKNEPFYIGIGTEKRTKDVKIRNSHWKNVYNINNQQIEVEILLDGLSWKDACKKETWWINFYGRKDLQKGPLVNLTNGGEGAQGRKKSKETLEKFKSTMKAKGVHHMKNYKHSQEAINKIREAGKRKKSIEEIERIKKSSIGRPKTKEEVQNWRISKAKNKTKIINVITKEEYAFINEVVAVQSDYNKNMVINRLSGKVNDPNFPYKYKI